MAAKNVAEAGLEPAVAAPSTLLRDVLQEGLGAIKARGYAVIQLTPAAREAMDRLRASQAHFFSESREEKKKYVQCHPVNTHGISEVMDLKYYFQGRAGGSGSALPFPGPSDAFAGDFGIDATDVYTQLDLLGRACLVELAPTLNIPLQRIVQLLDPIGRASVDMQKLSKEEILALKFKSTREEGQYVASDLFVPNYVSSSNLDLFYYHNIEETRTKWALNHPAHTDSGIISFIPVSTIPALDFFDQKLNIWIEIEKAVHEQAAALGGSYQDYVIAMAGDTLESLAKFSFKAGLHRVVRTDVPRESAVYKLRARPELVGPKYEVDYKVVQVQRKALGLPEL
jgi:hypothetical protein